MPRLSVIVPTYMDRTVLLRRVIAYMRQALSESPLDMEIVVADSSSQRSQADNEAAVGEAEGGISVRHLRFEESTELYSKLLKAALCSDAEFIVVCADDDFLIPQGLAAAVAFLQENPSYAVATGQSLVLSNLRSGTLGEAQHWRARNYAQSSLEWDKPSIRLREHLSHYTTTFYGVHRHDLFVRCFEAAQKSTKDYRFGEMLASCLGVITGKRKALDCFYMVRTVTAARATIRLEATLMRTWADLVFSEDFHQRWRSFLATLTQELLNHEPLTSEAAELEITRSFQGFVATKLAQECAAPATRRQRMKRGLDMGTAAARRMLASAAGVFGDIADRRNAIFDNPGVWMEAVKSPLTVSRLMRDRTIGDSFTLVYESLSRSC